MNLHDYLGRHGADATAGSRSRLESVDVRQALDARVRRGRQRRALGGGVGAVAGVALVGFGVWTVMPGAGGGGGDLDPATPSDPHAVTFHVPADTIVHPAPSGVMKMSDALHSSDLVCGATVGFDHGSYVHDERLLNDEWTVNVTSLAHGEVPAPLANPSSISVDTQSHVTRFSAAYEGDQGDNEVMQSMVPLLLRDGVIVGVGAVESGEGSGSYLEFGEGDLPTPLPGDCDIDEYAKDTYLDGVYEPVFVTRLWVRVGDAPTLEPLATVVFSAGEVEYTGIGTPVPEDSTAPAEEPAALRAPEGDVHQAFVVPSPEVSCAPFWDQLDAGQPGVHNIQYDVEVPGVAESLTREIGARQPYVTLPEGYEPWYKGVEAWVVSERVNEPELLPGPQTLRDPMIEWIRTSDGATAVVPGGNDAWHDPSCYYELPGAVTDGAVFLVVQGYDIEVMTDLGYDGSTHNPAEWYTWIYLGEAD